MLRACPIKGEPTVGMLFCGWPRLLGFGREPLPAGIHSSLKSKNLLGVASVQNCSLQRLITSGPLSRCAGSILVFKEEMSSLAGLPSRKCLAMNIPSMPGVYELAYRFAAALGIGLLIGAERERRKGEGPSLPGGYTDVHDCFSVRRSEL